MGGGERAGSWNAWSSLVGNRLRGLLSGTLWGEQLPPRPAPPLPSQDARTHALRALRSYIAEINFRRRIGNPGIEESYRLEESRILLEWPDSAENLLFPRIEFEPGPAEYLPRGTTPITFERGDRQHGPLTQPTVPVLPTPEAPRVEHERVADSLLVCSHEYQERIVVVVWATTRAQRRSLAAGLEQMLSAPLEETPGLRLRLPTYYDRTANFQLLERQNVDDEDSARRRRKARITLLMRVDVVRRVHARTLRPYAVTNVYV